MGNVRTRITKKTGAVRTTTSWGGKRGVTNSTSYGNNGSRITWSTNQKTGRTRVTQSQKVGPNSWYVTSKTSGMPRRRGRKPKIKSSSELFWTLLLLGALILFIL